MDTILVAGGAGFVGSHFCERFVGEDFKVICLDNLITGSLKNIQHLRKCDNFEFIKSDISKDSLRYKKLSYIVHLASPASPVGYQAHPLETALANSLGTLNLLKLAAATGSRFLFASTSEIYGDPLEHPQKETYWGNVNSFGARSCYDESKRFGEALVYIFINRYHVKANIIRIFNTYGPRMQKDDGRVVSNFINQALEDKPLTVYGKGLQTRSFCYVDDLIDGIEKIILKKDLEGKVINLGNPSEYRIIDFAKKIIKITGSASKIVYKPLPSDDPIQRKPDIAKAIKILNWRPRVSLKEGLAKTIEYYKNEV